MRVRKLAIALMCLLVLFAVGVFAQAKKAPATKLKFDTKFGAVNFDHATHSEKQKLECNNCHPKPWPQDAKAPLNFKGGAMHKTAETAKSSCATCHVAGGTAFAVKGSCNKCHMKPGAKG